MELAPGHGVDAKADTGRQEQAGMQGGKLKGAIAGGAMAAGVRGKRLPQPMPISVLAACVVAATAAPEASRAQAVQQQEYSIEAQPLDRALRRRDRPAGTRRAGQIHAARGAGPFVGGVGGDRQ
ncbi:hypothetical protein G6F57_018407 [Rhizopus arrhizus]|nr:hypothetical protein G6F57_018407 [Rhizopus arrhizus]